MADTFRDVVLDNVPIERLPDLVLYGLADNGDQAAEVELTRRGGKLTPADVQQ